MILTFYVLKHRVRLYMTVEDWSSVIRDMVILRADEKVDEKVIV
jgi:hypothetical protein